MSRGNGEVENKTKTNKLKKGNINIGGEVSLYVCIDGLGTAFFSLKDIEK